MASREKPPSAGFVDVRFRGRREDIDELLSRLGPVVQLWHERIYGDDNGVTVRHYLRADLRADLREVRSQVGEPPQP